MKQRTKISKVFLIVSFVVTLVSFLVPTAEAEDSIIRLDPVWYWSPNLTIPEHSSKAAPTLAVFNDQLHMVSVGSKSKNLYHSFYNGILWSEEVRISNHMTQAGPSMTLYNGNLHLVHLGSNNTSIYHCTYNGSSWTGSSKVLNYSSGVSPAVAAFDGLLHMVHKSESSTAIYHSTYNGSSWTDHGAIPDQGTQASPALAVFNGQLHMVNVGSTSNDLWHSYYNGSSWSSKVKILDFTTQDAPALTECNSGLHMVHKGETTGDIYHSDYNGTSWTSHGTIPNQTTQTASAIGTYNDTMHILHLGPSSSDIYESFYVSLVCSVPAYQPDFWNFYNQILRNNNCYNYSNNKRTDTFAQPGRAAGQMYTALTCAAVIPAAIADGISQLEGTDCPSGETKIALVVAPGYDYHWYRQDSNGYWSHKPGGTAATNLDNSGEIITNPETADRGAYTDFCSYFCSCEDEIQGISHEIIRAAGIEEPAGQKSIKEGLKITIMMYSGRPNPSYQVSDSEHGNKKTIMELFALVEPNTSFRGETILPSILGYNGILVEKIGNFKDFPYDRLYIYKENIEIDAPKTGRKQFLLDGGRNLEHFLLQLALEKGVLSTEMLKHID
jgi:hypothetical protein